MRSGDLVLSLGHHPLRLARCRTLRFLDDFVGPFAGLIDDLRRAVTGLADDLLRARFGFVQIFLTLARGGQAVGDFFWRSSMAPMSQGQKNFMTAQATRKNTTPWMTSVNAKFIAYSLPSAD